MEREDGSLVMEGRFPDVLAADILGGPHRVVRYHDCACEIHQHSNRHYPIQLLGKPS